MILAKDFMKVHLHSVKEDSAKMLPIEFSTIRTTEVIPYPTAQAEQFVKLLSKLLTRNDRWHEVASLCIQITLFQTKLVNF